MALILFLFFWFRKLTLHGCYMLEDGKIAVKRRLFINTSESEHILNIAHVCLISAMSTIFFFFSSRQNSGIPRKCWTSPPPGGRYDSTLQHLEYRLIISDKCTMLTQDVNKENCVCGKGIHENSQYFLFTFCKPKTSLKKKVY